MVQDLERLPKWAQSEIKRLRMRVEEMEAERAVGPEDSDTFLWAGGIDASQDKPLGKRAKIDFRPKGGMILHPQFSVYMADGVLDVSGTDYITVEPRAANSIQIAFRRDFA